MCFATSLRTMNCLNLSAKCTATAGSIVQAIRTALAQDDCFDISIVWTVINPQAYLRQVTLDATRLIRVSLVNTGVVPDIQTEDFILNKQAQ